MTPTRIDRPLGLLEKYQISKQTVKAYGNVVLAAQLEHPAGNQKPHLFFRNAFQPALAHLIQTHPSLSVIVRNANESTAHFEQLTTVDISAIVNVVDNLDNLQELIRNEICKEFDIEAYNPLWRLSVMPTSETTCTVVFAAHHVICDGMSLAIFWKDFLNALNTYYGAGIKDEQQLITVPDVKMAAPYELCNPPEISIIWDVIPILFKNFAPNFLPEFLVNYINPLKHKAWQGDQAAVEGEPHNTNVRLICVPRNIWKPLMVEAKSRKISAHAILYIATISSWAELYPGCTTEVGTPINCRSICRPPISPRQMGNFVGNHVAVWSDKQLSKNSNGKFWCLAASYHEDVQKNKVKAAKQSLYLNFLPEYPESFSNFWYDKRKNSRLGRAGGIEVSDLGRFEDEGVKISKYWNLQNLHFCQSAQVFTNALQVNSVSFNDNLYLTLSWQKGALEESKINKFHDVFIRTLDRISVK